MSIIPLKPDRTKSFNERVTAVEENIKALEDDYNYSKADYGPYNERLQTAEGNSLEAKNKAVEALTNSADAKTTAYGTKTRQDNLESRYNQQLANLTNSTVQNAEIVDARDGEVNLGEKIRKISSQMAESTNKISNLEINKLDKTGMIAVNQIDKNRGLIDETYLSDTLKAQMAGTTAIGSTPPDRSITLAKTTFAKTGKNLFDRSKATVDYSVSSSTGQIGPNPGYSVSDYIPVLPNTTYTRSHEHTLAFYDSNKVYISGIGSAENIYTFTTPANAYYIRTSFVSSFISVMQVELGTKSTAYEPYYQVIDKKYLEENSFDINKVPDRAIPPIKTSFFTTGKNLFNKATVTSDYAVSATDGSLVPSTGYCVSDFIPVLPNTTYTRSHEHSLAFYDSNKVFISGVTGSADIYTFTTPANAYYIRTTFRNTELNLLQVELGTKTTMYEPYKVIIPNDLVGGSKFAVDFTTVSLKPSINEIKNQNLYLIATKKNNYYSAVIKGTMPTDCGYLYLDELNQKLYYSKETFDKPEYLCDWVPSIAGGLRCEDYHATITKDGDIIFFKNPYGNTVRTNPIIYKAGNYNSPQIIDFGINPAPFGFAIDNGVEHNYKDDYFIFGEYRGWSEADIGSDIYIWKVSKPYDNPASWRKVLTRKVTHFNNPVGSYPGQEIGHFHTANYDFYSGAWIVTTGDVQEQVRIFISKDSGETWTEQNVGGGQSVRTVGLIFTKDYVYYQTDSTLSNHALYKVPRDVNGYPDFTLKQKVTDLSQTGEAGYVTAYMREPNGLLFLDRAEPRSDNKLDFYFYSFEYEKLFHLGRYERIDNGDIYDSTGRHGFPVLAFTHYQSIYEDGIICGGTTKTKPFTLKILGNNHGNMIGVLKIKVKKVG